MTLNDGRSAYVQLANCEQPSVITKDLCATILGRDARSGSRALKVPPQLYALEALAFTISISNFKDFVFVFYFSILKFASFMFS